ncbi:MULTISPECIES: PaeR7I family type II restriction endonuclease [unclassified Xanthomonas]|uniref:PaeR7I family type II restriction endonuclease n=1 Tax=unclassified Xanthomonas TaxID=2643310 RepID=UPI002A8043CE|nr:MULTISPECIES: PaeR7I family type II restriction endonuclease [unclassified Xanthomonas]MDY4297366.1 PaeR7I family type II restriction endonuclease [Xanthomonas sp. LF02-5]MDY4359160.1 PaeR7I family type II restriction endonuclease [Xanthomonas sp. LF04-12]
MTLDLSDYDRLTRLGVAQFWTGRSSALENDEERSQGGERAGVLGGRNMDGFLAMIEGLVRKNGLPDADIWVSGRPNLTLPGFYRPTKLWDVLVFSNKKLVAAIELKSHVGPSFGNNFNNRAEEAIGTAHDLATAIREGALGDQHPPFTGWLILVEDCEKSNRPVRDRSPHFPVSFEFQGASYLTRYEVLCRRLMREGLYSQATIIASPRAARLDGSYRDLSQSTGLRAFAVRLAAHIAGWANL